jgi:Fic family protein
MSFREGRLERFAVPTGTAWLLTDVAEAKGRQHLYTHQAPQLLRALRETALVQSVESSNRIEGVTVAPERLVPLVIGQVRPLDRSEEEVQGYRRALDLIHLGTDELAISPELLLRLHATIQAGSGDAGQWKRADNEIVELREGAPPRIRFRPVAAAATPVAIAELCLLYRRALAERQAPPLLAVAALVFDFLCVHPFRDGNGRVSRLLTLLALSQHGYEVGRYVSLERLVEESRSDYYDVLQRSSQGWHEASHDLLPWLNYFLAVLRRAYRQFEASVGQVKTERGAKTSLVESAIAGLERGFTLADLERACPGVSRDMVRKVLQRLQRSGQIECTGRGPGATWRKRG